MGETLELPNGDVVEPDEVLLHDGYPYRYVPIEDDTYDFLLSPLYWGDSGMDIPFRDRDALVEQWSDDSRGTLTPAQWEDWLEAVRDEDWIDAEEAAALARELPTGAPVRDDTPDGESGVLARLRRLVGR
jgi:hypothetical protein